MFLELNIMRSFFILLSGNIKSKTNSVKSTYSPTPTLNIDFASLTLVTAVSSEKHSVNFMYSLGSNRLV